MNTSIQNHTLSFGSLSVDVVLKDIKNVHLSVYPPFGDIKVAAPLWTNIDTLRVYLCSRIGWIKQQQSKISLQKRISPRECLTRESHFVRGQRYLMKVTPAQSQSQIILEQNTINLVIKTDASKEQKIRVLENWQRLELKKDVELLLIKWEPIIGVESNNFVIRKMKTKWGSCNIESKTLNINLALIEKSNKLLEYVIVHELVHLLERNHTNLFVAYMDKFIPEWRALKVELNEYSPNI
jgi:predicted metal-dependent hydrolase